MGPGGVEPPTSRLSAGNDDGNVDPFPTNHAPINAYVHPKTPPLLPGPLPGASVSPVSFKRLLGAAATNEVPARGPDCQSQYSIRPKGATLLENQRRARTPAR